MQGRTGTAEFVPSRSYRVTDQTADDRELVRDPDGDGDDDTAQETQAHEGPLTADLAAALEPKRVG